MSLLSIVKLLLSWLSLLLLLFRCRYYYLRPAFFVGSFPQRNVVSDGDLPSDDVASPSLGIGLANAVSRRHHAAFVQHRSPAREHVHLQMVGGRSGGGGGVRGGLGGGGGGNEDKSNS